MLQGIVLRRQANFYYVQTEGRIFECQVRGRLKKEGIEVLVGDHVEISEVSDSTGAIEEVAPRRTLLIRPPVANVDQVLAVFAVKEPEPIFQLLDRILVTAEAVGIGAVVCFNKADLATSEELEKVESLYSRAGYRVVLASAKQSMGMNDLEEVLKDRVTCLAGPSGVGKSSLLNTLGGLNLETGSVSRKLQRGRHTTRHVELFSLAGGLVADTPGFSRLSLDVESDELSDLFPEFHEVGPCRFNSCLHVKEPECAVREALSRGEIAQSRYQSYLALLEEIERERRY